MPLRVHEMMKYHWAETQTQAINPLKHAVASMGSRWKEKNIPVERSEPSVALMVNGTIVAPLLVGDGTPLVAPALLELPNEVIPNVAVEKELSDPVKVEPEPVVGVGLILIEFELLIVDSEVAVGDPAELEGAEIEGVGLDGNEFEGEGFWGAELESPLNGEELTSIELKATELGAPDGTVFVPLKIAVRLVDSPMSPDDSSEVKALPVAVGATVTLFSCLG